MKLVIVESPTKAKTLSSILPKDYAIEASMGHIRDLPKSGLGVDVEKNFEVEYVVPPKAKKTLTSLKKKSKDVEEIILATDPDREGEAIAWHLEYLLTPRKGNIKFGRVVFHELTESAIKEAFKNLGKVDMNLVDAQQARRVLDRLVGYKLSPLLWKKVMYGLSAGRVQSVAVRLIVERERERQSFKPDEYWSMKGLFEKVSSKEPFEAFLFEKNGKKVEIKNKEEAKKIEGDLKGDMFKISSIEKSKRESKPYAPFSTSTLQQAMSNVFGFTAKRTMSAAQSLFEQGIITYHRTDSLNLSPVFVNNARGFVEDQFGKEYLPEKGVFYKTKSKNAQEAHEAIRPTNLLFIPGKGKKKLKSDELKVYSVIWKRSLECQMAPAVYDLTTIKVESSKKYLFKAVGSYVKFDGWFAIGKYLGISTVGNGNGESDQTLLPELSLNDKVALKGLISEQHFTQPPARYTDATLIKKMEEIGVGRPSTYAPTITTIQSRGYVEKDGRSFIPKDVAYVVNDLLVAHFPDIIDYGFTAEMEEDLDEVAEGKKKWIPLVRNFYEPFEKTLVEKDKALSKSDVTNLGESGEACPECGKPLVFKLGKYGKFLSCSGYPDCKYAKPLVGENGENEQKDYGKCPNCSDGVLKLKQGRFGKFLACSNYPKCKTTQNFMDKVGVKCPKCGTGDVVVKRAKRKKFYGCSRYPDCDYSSWRNPLLKKEKKRESVTSLF
ncbi:type I DNA topoisomerase [candidate division WWE3 bacterium]|uniref:DNA topoisomerase 1 n=1 Tax=candidate division WWE3 bacterium TaxID=2053526 RepID=A0A7X9E7U4_UNCKA|nr:type I DNA topoisomerase [candidate division WWE3 bacterium]